VRGLKGSKLLTAEVPEKNQRAQSKTESSEKFRKERGC
jgi:hypothetical protein